MIREFRAYMNRRRAGQTPAWPMDPIGVSYPMLPAATALIDSLAHHPIGSPEWCVLRDAANDEYQIRARSWKS